VGAQMGSTFLMESTTKDFNICATLALASTEPREAPYSKENNAPFWPM
jgi:4'-phosphopantetheinyl transferase EntD